MKKMFAILALIAGIQAQVFAATVRTSFTAAGVSAPLRINPGETMTYTITGSYQGRIQLEQATNGKDYSSTGIVATTSGTVTGSLLKVTRATFYRWNCTARTSGTFVTTLADNDDFIREVLNTNQSSLLKFYDNGIRLPAGLALVPGATLSVSSGTSFSWDNMPSVMNVWTSTGGPLLMNATPAIATAPYYVDGAMYVIQSDTATLTLQDNGTLSGSLLELGSTTRALGVGDILVLLYRAGKWWEIGFYNN